VPLQAVSEAAFTNFLSWTVVSAQVWWFRQRRPEFAQETGRKGCGCHL